MMTKKKATKIVIVFILLVFLIITGLSAIVPYMGKNNPNGTGDISSGAIVESGINAITGTETIDTGAAQLPEMTKEEASAKLQQMLSGITPAGTTDSGATQ